MQVIACTSRGGGGEEGGREVGTNHNYMYLE